MWGLGLWKMPCCRGAEVLLTLKRLIGSHLVVWKQPSQNVRFSILQGRLMGQSLGHGVCLGAILEVLGRGTAAWTRAVWAGERSQKEEILRTQSDRIVGVKTKGRVKGDPRFLNWTLMASPPAYSDGDHWRFLSNTFLIYIVFILVSTRLMSLLACL